MTVGEDGPLILRLGNRPCAPAHVCLRPRCVVMVGMPYPNIMSPELQEKMAYLDQTLVSTSVPPMAATTPRCVCLFAPEGWTCFHTPGCFRAVTCCIGCWCP